MSLYPFPQLTALAPDLFIFDKGGTLIDFRRMWREWVVELAHRLEGATGFSVAAPLFEAMGFDPRTGRIAPEGRLATTPMAGLRRLTVEVLCQTGLSPSASAEAVGAVWFAPDPATQVRPLADLPALFGALRQQGARVAVATMDDREPTEATFAWLGVRVDGLVCGDDGLPLKPAPDMVWEICRRVGVPPERSVVVGDAVADMEMGRAAGAGLVVGVLSGVSPSELLAPRADLVVGSVGELVGLA